MPKASVFFGGAPVVDFAGNPLTPPRNPDGSPYTGGLLCFSVFGNVKADGSPFTANDCAGGTSIIGTAWDTLRPGIDATGYVQKLIAAMPRANFWASGRTNTDSLNLASFQWWRGRNGATGGAAQAGTSPELINRKQINIKIDENFTDKIQIASSTIRRHKRVESPGRFGLPAADRPEREHNGRSLWSDSGQGRIAYGRSNASPAGAGSIPVLEVSWGE